MKQSHFLRSYVFTLCLFLIHSTAMARSTMSLPDFTELAESNRQAVVNISTMQKGKTKGRLPKGFSIPELPEGSPFNDLFKHFFEGEGSGHGGRGELEPREARSLGSGFIIEKDGYILTNYHVVADANEIIVRLSDRKTYDAKVIGFDKASDVALLKIDADSLPTLQIGQSRDLKVGEWVLAIGSPFGFDHTVTAGIVSAKGRSLPKENYVPFIQTDVAINPGNSGGPLFNLDGEVVGINSQIYSRTGGFMGLSFAIPIELAMNVADQLKETGHVARGYLGVLIQDVDRTLAESFGMKHPRGALVAKVIPDSPAEDAGIEIGDIILEFNGHKLNTSSQLPPLVGISRIGKKSTLEILRAGKRLELDVEVSQLPNDAEPDIIPATIEETDTNRLGLSVVNVKPLKSKRLGLKEGQGVTVASVSDGPAKKAGIRKGDVITMLSGKIIQGTDDFEEQVNNLEDGQSLAVLVHRKKGPLFMALRLPE